LVSFIAAPRDSDCLAAPSDVEVLGIFRESIDNSPQIRWTSGTNDGIPQVIGQTSGGGRSIVLASDSEATAGYFVAYGAASGGLALHFVPEFTFSPNDKYELATPHTTAIRSTAPLELGESEVLFSDRDVDYVALTQVVADDRIRLGVAWLEGACGSDAKLSFAEVSYSEDEGFKAGSELTVATLSKPPAGPPTLSYVDSGFVMPGYESPETGDLATTSSSGGFVVAWADGDVLYARRILDLDRQLLDEAPIELLEGDGALSAQLFYAAEQTRFAAFEHDSSTLKVGEVSCNQ
ncbi:MAG TPA: hypothetical protein VGK49_00305, partial [Ilumatobacteraceae bacterium]